jgi:hypothetical protein
MSEGIDLDALRRVFAGPDFDPGIVRRRYLVVTDDGVPRELREPDDREPESEGAEESA